ncbi:MAG: helix-turn-helix transcriptional regulator [Spirochaetota bacterium]
MDHFIFFVYVTALVLGCGALTLVLLSWYRYRTLVWGLYTAVIAAVSILVILDMLAAYRIAAHIPLTALSVVRPFIGIPAQSAIVMLLVLLAHTVVSLSIARPLAVVYGMFFVLYAAGAVANVMTAHPSLSIAMDVSFAAVIAYASVLIAVRFSAIRSVLLRSLVLSIGVPTLCTVAGAAVLSFLPYRTVHYALFTGYYSVLAVLTIVHALRYLSRGEEIRENAAAFRGKGNTALTRLFARVKLTAREEEMLSYVASGYSNGSIAERVAISHQTVKNHVYRAYQKFGIRTRNEFIEMIISGTDSDAR